MPSVPKNSVVVSTEKEKTPTQISSEYRDSDYDIYEVPTQILFTPNKNGGITELPESSKDDKTDISTVLNSCSMAVAGQLNCTVGDYDNNDSIFEAATQIVKTPNTSNKDFIKPFAFSPVEERKNSACDYVDDDDSIFEAPTQILETPNRSGKEFTKVCSPSPEEEHINCDHDDSDAFSDAPTQTLETQDRGNNGFINASCISSKNYAVSVLMPNDNHKAENFSSSSGNEDPMDLGDKAHAPVMHNVSAERVNYLVNVSTEFKESCTSESRESHVIGDDKEKEENIRHTPQCFEKGFDKCSKRQNTAEVISQKDRNKVAEVVAAKNIFDVTDSGHLNAHEKHEIPVLKEVTPIQDALPVSVRSSEDQKVSMLGRCTVSAIASTVTLATGNVNSNNLLKVPPSKYTSETAETISLSTRTSKVNVKHKKFIGQPIDTGKDSVSNESPSRIVNYFVSSLKQDQRTEGTEWNFDLQECMITDHSKDADESEKIPVGTAEIPLDSKRLEPENSYIQNENDFKSCSGISQQVPQKHLKPISEEFSRVVDMADAPLCDSLNGASELTIPSSQDLANAVRECEATESPFKGEVFIPSEEEEPVPTVKLIRHGHLPSNRAKVRKRLNIKNRSSDTSDESSRRHLPDEVSTDVNVMSKTTAGVSRTGRRRGELHHEVFVQSDISDIQASKNRKLSQKDSLQNDRENMTSDIISIYSTRGCAEEIHQSGTKVVMCMDKERIGRGRKSKAAVMKNKEQVKTAASVEWSGEAKGGRSSKEVTEPLIDECNVPGKIRKEHSINTNEDVEDAVTISSRPSRQRKMTWKVQDSLGSDDSKGSINFVKERPKKRGRGSSSHNSKNLLNENPECNTGTTTRSRNVSPTKLPSKKLLKSSVIDTFKEEQKSIQNTFVAPEPDVSQRESTRQSKVGNAVTSASDISKDQSSQRMTRQNNRKVESNNLQKQKNVEKVTEISSGHPKEEEQFFPDMKFQRNITDRCSPKRSKIGLENFKDASSESIIKVSGRRQRQTSNVGFVQEPSADITHTNTLSTEGEKPLCFSIGSLQDCTGRSIRHRMEVMNTSFPCLKKETASVSLHTTSRTQLGEKRTMLSTEGDDKHLPTKRSKIEKRLTQPHTPSKISVQNDKVKSVPLSRTNRTRGQVSNLQKLETSGTVKQDTELAERENISQISKTEEVNKKLKNEPLTLRSCSINSSEGQDMTPKRASRRGTPQNGIQHNSQKNGSNSGTSTPRRSTPRKVASSNRTTHQVLFTGFSDTRQESIVRQLGGCVVDLPESCSVLVTDKVRRTYKFLCIVGQGKPIVSPRWLVQSQRSGHFLDPWQYLVKDQESESKFKFRLKESLETAAQTDLLAGYNVYVTPSVKPPPLEMRGIIESCGGVFMTQAATKSWPVNSFIISCMDDKVSWSKLKKSGKPIVGPEVLLLGVLQQNLDLKSNVFV